MDLTFSERETAFRDELRAWFAANDPGPEPPHHSEQLHFAWRRDFQRRLYDAGWAAPHWPVEHGGHVSLICSLIVSCPTKTQAAPATAATIDKISPDLRQLIQSGQGDAKVRMIVQTTSTSSSSSGLLGGLLGSGRSDRFCKLSTACWWLHSRIST